MAIAALFAIWQTPLTAEATDKDKLEVFSWWTSGGEAAALNGLFNVYKKQDPGVEIVNATIAGGGGSAARPVLQTRLAASDPPDSWQTHPGWELLGQYVEPGYCEPITELYKSDGWDKAFPKELVANLMTKDRKIYAVLDVRAHKLRHYLPNFHIVGISTESRKVPASREDDQYELGSTPRRVLLHLEEYPVRHQRRFGAGPHQIAK